MQRYYLPFSIFAVINILTIPWSFDYATSVVPGWHTVVFPPIFLANFFITVTLVVVTIGYLILAKSGYKVNWILFIAHLVLTIPTVILIRFPFLLWNISLPLDQDELVKMINWETNLNLVGWFLFIAGQIMFLVYFFKTYRLRSQIK